MKETKTTRFTLEKHVNSWVEKQFEKLSLHDQTDYHSESAMPNYMIEALRGRAKTESKTNFGKPDFSFTKYNIPVVIENKLGLSKLVNETKEGIKFDATSI